MLLSSPIRNQRRTFEVVMTKAEEMGPEWLQDDGFTARLTVTLRRDRFLHPGKSFLTRIAFLKNQICQAIVESMPIFISYDLRPRIHLDRTYEWKTR